MAFEKTREMIVTNMAEIHQNIREMVDGHCRKMESGIEPDAESTEPPTDSTGSAIELADTTADDSVKRHDVFGGYIGHQRVNSQFSSTS